MSQQYVIEQKACNYVLMFSRQRRVLSDLYHCIKKKKKALSHNIKVKYQPAKTFCFWKENKQTFPIAACK